MIFHATNTSSTIATAAAATTTTTTTTTASINPLSLINTFASNLFHFQLQPRNTTNTSSPSPSPSAQKRQRSPSSSSSASSLSSMHVLARIPIEEVNGVVAVRDNRKLTNTLHRLQSANQQYRVRSAMLQLRVLLQKQHQHRVQKEQVHVEHHDLNNSFNNNTNNHPIIVDCSVASDDGCDNDADADADELDVFGASSYDYSTPSPPCTDTYTNTNTNNTNSNSNNNNNNNNNNSNSNSNCNSNNNKNNIITYEPQPLPRRQRQREVVIVMDPVGDEENLSPSSLSSASLLSTFSTINESLPLRQQQQSKALINGNENDSGGEKDSWTGSFSTKCRLGICLGSSSSYMIMKMLIALVLLAFVYHRLV